MRVRSTLGWSLFTLARTLLALAGMLLGPQAPLGPLAGQTADALRKVQPESARPV